MQPGAKSFEVDVKLFNENISTPGSWSSPLFVITNIGGLRKVSDRDTLKTPGLGGSNILIIQNYVPTNHFN